MDYLEMIKKREIRLGDVPEKLRTPEMCLESVKISGTNLHDVPSKLRTELLCSIALEDPRGFAVLGSVPEKLRTPERCLAAVKIFGNNLVHVPEKYKTETLCLEAVNNRAKLEYVPYKIITEEMCVITLISGGYIPDSKKTSRVYLEAVKQDFPLNKVPDEFKTKIVCLVAFLKNSDSIYYSPFSEKELLDLEKTLTEEMASKRLPKLKKHGPHFAAKFDGIISSFANELNGEAVHFDKYKGQGETSRLEREELFRIDRLERERERVEMERQVEAARVVRERENEAARLEMERQVEAARVEREKEDEAAKAYAAAEKDAALSPDQSKTALAEKMARDKFINQEFGLVNRVSFLPNFTPAKPAPAVMELTRRAGKRRKTRKRHKTRKR